jgi:intraflagellar transport protein 122
MDVEVARAAFIRLRDVRSVELVNRVAAGLAAGTPKSLLLADVASWQGDFDQAAKLYVSEGQLDKVRGCVRACYVPTLLARSCTHV